MFRNKAAAAVLASVFTTAVLLVASSASALEIKAFNDLKGPDKDRYLATLTFGTAQILLHEGKVEMAYKRETMFAAPGGQPSPSHRPTEKYQP
jgi:hypothetical protein